jgi:hypothetical protein
LEQKEVAAKDASIPEVAIDENDEKREDRCICC